MSPAERAGDAPELVVEERFAIVPEWLLDAEIGDCAVRLYAVLLRYGASSGARMPGRATLARRLRKQSTDTVDRAMRDLVGVGAVVVEHRYEGRQRLTNRYHLRTSRPRSGGGRTDAATPAEPEAPGRTDAATRTTAGRGGGRTDAAGVAAPMRHDRESSTETTPPPPPPQPSPRSRPARSAGSTGRRGTPEAPEATFEQTRADLVAACAISDWDGFVTAVRERRRAVGGRLGSWSGAHLLAALHLAVRNRGWPAAMAPHALLAVAADAETRTPARLAEAGPWWDEPERPDVLTGSADELAGMEADLEAADGLRVWLQRQARDELSREGVPLTRATVVRRAHQLWRERRDVGAPESTLLEVSVS